MEFLRFIFSNFWIFLGTFFVVSLVVQFMFKGWNRFMRMLMVKKHGWPPDHLDASGSWKPEKKDDDQ